MTDSQVRHCACGAELPPNKAPGRQRKWCSEACRKETLYAGTCDTCGGPTNGSNGHARAATRCMECLKWTPEAIAEALREWGDDHGGIPPRAIDPRLGEEGHGRLPYERTVKKYFGTWNAGLLAAGYTHLNQDKRPETTQAMAEMIRQGMSTADVGERFGVGSAAVYVRLAYHGTPVSELRSAA